MKGLRPHESGGAPPTFRILSALLAVLFLLAAPAIPVAAAAGGTGAAATAGPTAADLVSAAPDGGPGAPALTAAAWRQLYLEARRAAPAWPPLPALVAGAGRRLPADEVPLALLSLAGERPVLAAAALRQVTHRGAEVRFRLERRHAFSGPGARVVSVAVDPGDGGGWRALPWGRPVPARYGETGDHAVRLRATLADGKVLEAGLQLEVAHLATPLPQDTLAVAATVPYQGVAGTGEAYVYLAEGRTQIVKPVVVVEGLDLDNSMGWDEFYWLLDQEGLLETMRAEGYDAVVLNFTDATDYLQRNAFVLVALLQEVADRTAPWVPSTLVGASMGGVVGRYALAWMEHEGLSHPVGTFISFDAPHRGGVIPLGLQYWIQFFADRSAEAALLQQQLGTPAARQLLIYHATDPPSATAGADPLRADLLADLAAIGDWPVLPRLVAVANGSGLGADQGFAPGDQLIRYEYDSFLVDIRGNVWAVPDGGGLRIFQGLIDQIWPLPDTSLDVSVSGTEPWDGAPGGWRASMAQMDTTAVDYGDIVALHDDHCFVPTVSALALAGVGPFHDVAGDPDLMSRTPFDAVHWPAANQEHMTITAESAPWFLEEIRGTVTAAGPVADGAGAAPTARVRLDVAPNPFNPGTDVGFRLATAGPVRLDVVTLDGRIVRTLVDGPLPAGPHRVRWDGRDGRGRPAASGTYLCRLRAGDRGGVGKMVLLK